MLLLILCLVIQGCALVGGTVPEQISNVALYRPQDGKEGDNLLQRYAPSFEVQDYQSEYNRIGAAAARPTNGNDYEVYIDTKRPTVYGQIQKFTTGKGNYTNLIYRVNFPEVPWPRLTWGRNVGLLVYVTLNSRAEPVLITTVHTCGCYLAMIPTSKLPQEDWPTGWLVDAQNIYGENLPSHLELPPQAPYGRLVITVRDETHRVMKVEFRQHTEARPLIDPATVLAPMTELDHLPLDESRVSFFEKKGRRRGYVKGSSKPLERLFMSWWALDQYVGRDKALGPPEETGVNLYTSLKFWARKESNIWFFARFLEYWGWKF